MTDREQTRLGLDNPGSRVAGGERVSLSNSDTCSPLPADPPRYMAFVGYLCGTVAIFGLALGIVLGKWFL